MCTVFIFSLQGSACVTIVGQAVSWMMLGKLLLRRLLPSRHNKDGGEFFFF